MSLFDQIVKPTLLLDTRKAQLNIEKMALKARAQNIRFRPHFKTHLSNTIGNWFRACDVTSITVSSVDMALYFAKNGWKDILIAFPVNWRQIQTIQHLADIVKLGLIVESSDTIKLLAQHLHSPVDVWIKIDVGNKRTGVDWENTALVQQLATEIRAFSHLRLAGVLTHAGHTYHATSKSEIVEIYNESVERINTTRKDLLPITLTPVEVSVGDTPGCSVAESLGPVDEIRPGNFIFYDAQQLIAGSCSFEDIAVSVACPVVAKHPDRNEIIIYGGAIHLSKDTIEVNGKNYFGLVSLPEQNGWQPPLENAFVTRLSQEHGMIKMTPEDFSRVNIGDLLCVTPAHSCLTVQALRYYLTLDGEWISTFDSTGLG